MDPGVRASRLDGGPLRVLCLVVAIALLSGRTAAAEALLEDAGRIPLPKVGGRIDHFAEDVAGRRLFLSALGNDTIEVIDLAAGRVVRSIAGVKEPQGVGYVPGIDRLVIAEGGGDAVDILDGASFARVGRIEHLDDADNVRVEASTHLVYVGVGSGRSASLTVIDAQAASLLRQLPLPGHPEAFALEDGGVRIFVNVPDDRAVLVLDRATGATLARWALRGASANFPMALDQAAHRLFVGCRSPATLLILDTADGGVVASLPCCGDADDVLLDPAAQRAYVVGGDGAITVIGASDPQRYAVLGSVDTSSGARTGLMDAAGRIVVACPHHTFGRDAEVRIFQPHRP
jgi:DNA-binding beta-propeller fold protein YncE